MDRGSRRARVAQAATFVCIFSGAGAGHAGAPAADTIPIKPRELPGLTFALPEAKEVDSKIAYTSGVLRMVIEAKHVVFSLTWDGGGLPEDEELRAAVMSMLKLEARPEPVDFPVGGGLPHRSLRFVRQGVPGNFTSFTCGGRRFSWLTLGDGAQSVHTRALASARCHPDPAQEAAEVVPVVMHVPADWKRVPAAAGQLLLAGASGTVLVRAIPGKHDPGAMERIIPSIANALHADLHLEPRETVKGPHGTRDVWYGLLTIKDEKMPLLVSAWPCADRGIGLILFHLPKTDAKTALTFVLDARCAAAGEKIPDYGATSVR
ncbi:MAG TPA: hypothetical protein VKE22_02165 [Haliangiales bacterium]|nr:hypothetical protein [Haliangiales bacterium]